MKLFQCEKLELFGTLIKQWFKFNLILFFIYSCIHANYKPVLAINIKPDMKYILQWTSPNTEPFKFMERGQRVFFKYNCTINNCYITPARRILDKLTDFHAILFHGPELSTERIRLPSIRSADQKYVFVSMESSHYYPIFNEVYDNFFNWTWTYKLNSDLYYGYMIIKNDQGEVIGPKETMNWLIDSEMKPIDQNLRLQLNSKHKLAAWFVSNCNTPSRRETYVNKMIKALAIYNMTVDIYGECSSKKCRNAAGRDVCNKLLKRSYYFYLSFENSFSEDYVTEKLLTALHNNAIPIVFGAANYTRFMPDNAYLNARKLSVRTLIRQMIGIIADTQKYYSFFKWRNHYSYHRTEDSLKANYYCKLCRRMNENWKEGSFYREFRQWWNPLYYL